MWWLVITAVVAYLIYFALIKPLGYWEKRRIAHKKPWPLLGNMAPVLFRKKSFVEMLRSLYNDFPDKRYNGLYSFTRPQLLIRDPELIKQVTIKDFDHFTDRTTVITEDIDPLFARNLVSLGGQKWRDMRATLSPTFTSSKMRFMFNLISDCGEQFSRYFESQGSEVISVEMKDVFSRFTTDAIATAAFGVTVDSLNEKNNEFFTMGKDATNFGGLRVLRFLGYSIFPALMKFLKISIFPEIFSEFFTRVIKETIDVRETKGVVRPDMIHLLLETRRGKVEADEQTGESDGGFAVVDDASDAKTESRHKSALTDVDITAQAMLFFFAGFETASTLMCFMSHELAVNKDIQERLQKEIDETVVTCGGKVTYEALLEMKYLDMVVSESLRKWTPGIAIDRICVKDFAITPKSPTEEPIIVEKGVTVMIPVVGLHYDPKYFPNPEKFDPERFNDENKSSILPGIYMPFGIGPRSCIASRFALMETKILFFHLLKQFDIVPTEKTPIPLVLSRKKFALAPDEGFWLGLQRRNRDEKN